MLFRSRLAQKYTEHGQAATAVLSSTLGRDQVSTYTRWVGQPTDVAMLDLLDRFGEHDVRESIGPRVSETPFSSERKWMGVTIGSETRGDKEKNAHLGRFITAEAEFSKTAASCTAAVATLRDGRSQSAGRLEAD